MIGDLSGSGFTPVSFVSDKNTNVELVQFAMRTEGIRVPEETNIPAAEEPMSFWQRLLALFACKAPEKTEKRGGRLLKNVQTTFRLFLCAFLCFVRKPGRLSGQTAERSPCLRRWSCRRGGDLSVVGKLFHTVSAPADHTGDGEDGGEQLGGKPQQLVYEAGVEVHVDADALVHLTLACNDLRSQLFYQIVQLEFLMQPFFHGELFHEGF